MNIFYLNSDPKQAAFEHCLKHKVKMILESAQMLASAYYVSNNIISSKQAKLPGNVLKVQEIFKDFPRKKPSGEIFPYGIGYVNHPSTIWSYSSIQNWQWLLDLAFELGFDYSRIYKKEHACMSILDWFLENPPNLPDIPFSEPPQAMPDECKVENNSILAYQIYYNKYKSTFAKWPEGEIPSWFKPENIQE
jgi:hypothetical protein